MDITDPASFTIKKRPFKDDFVTVEFICNDDKEAEKAIQDITQNCRNLLRLKQILQQILKERSD